MPGRMKTVGESLPTLPELEAAAALVYRSMAPTPQYRWPHRAQGGR